MVDYFYMVKLERKKMDFESSVTTEEVVKKHAEIELKKVFKGIADKFSSPDYGTGKAYFTIRTCIDTCFIVDFGLHEDVYVCLNEDLQKKLTKDKLGRLEDENGKCYYCKK